MTQDSAQSSNATWSWADMVSSYRFWGLCFFYIFTLFATSMLFYSYSYRLLMDQHGLSGTMVGTIMSARNIASLYGFYIGWLTIRSKKHYLLFIYAAVELLSIALFSFSSNYVLLYSGSILLGLSEGAIILIIPSFLAGGRGGALPFMIAFGIMYVIRTLSSLLSAATTALQAMDVNMGLLFFLSGGIAIIIGIIFLAPVKSTLFFEGPPQRVYPLEPKFREPVLAAVLCLIPFYYLYLLYRLHGEIASINSSNNILSARASVWLGLFIPFLFPPMLASLAEQLQEKAVEKNIPFTSTPWLIILLSFIFYPLCFAFLQSDLNKFLEKQTG